jgi:tetratricopeptide (TPR) repeat protein
MITRIGACGGRILSYARYVLDSMFMEDDVKGKLKLLWKISMCLYRDGRYNKAEKSFFPVIETRLRVLGEEHLSTLSSRANLALTYMNQGRWKEAEELFVQVMETIKRVLGVEHPDTLTSMANLALTYSRAGDASNGDEKEGAGPGASLYADQHGQPGVDVQELRAIEGDRRVVCVNDRDEKEGAGPGAFRHAG